MGTPRVGLLGRLAVHENLIDMDQLAEATRQRMAPGQTMRLGEILVDKGWITNEQLNDLLKAQRRAVEEEEKRVAMGGEAQSKSTVANNLLVSASEYTTEARSLVQITRRS